MDQDPSQIRQDIENTREELGDTVAALAAKTDVKAQARHKAEEIKHAAYERKEQLLEAAQHATPGSFDVNRAQDQARSASQRTLSTARSNPIAFGLIAFVVGLLLGRAVRRGR